MKVMMEIPGQHIHSHSNVKSPLTGQTVQAAHTQSCPDEESPLTVETVEAAHCPDEESPLTGQTVQAAHTQSCPDKESPLTGQTVQAAHTQSCPDKESPLTAETAEAAHTQSHPDGESPLTAETAVNVPCESSRSVNVDNTGGNVSELWRSRRKRDNKENENATVPKYMSAVRNLTSPLSQVEFGNNNSHMNINLNIPNTFDDDDDTLVTFGDNIEKEMEGIESIIQEDEDILYASGCAPHTQMT